MKNSTFVKITPVVDFKPIEKMQSKINAFSKSAKIVDGVKKTGEVIAKVGAGMTLLGLAFSRTGQQIDSVNDQLKTTLEYADRIGTLSADVGMSAGNFALLSGALSSVGVDEAGQEKLIRSIQEKTASGELKTTQNQSLQSIIQNLQKQWQGGNSTDRANIESTLGLRGKQASELLQSDLTAIMKSIEANTGLTAENLDKTIATGGDLEEKMAKALAISRIKLTAEVIATAQKTSGGGEGMILSTQQYELEKQREILRFYGSYEDMLKADKIKQQALNNLSLLADKVLSEVMGIVEGATGGKPLDAIVSLLLDGLIKQSSKLIGLLKTAWNSIVPSFLKTKNTDNNNLDAKNKDINDKNLLRINNMGGGNLK